MSALDAKFDRAARTLKVWDLITGPSKYPLSSVDELVHADDRFVDFYSESGLRKAFEHYGIAGKLEALGLSDYELVLGREDAFHHRLQAFAGQGRTLDDRILDLRLHLRQVKVGAEVFEAVGIDWLAMQNPRATFVERNAGGRAQLPGQSHPGTHLGRAVHNLLLIMTERIGREALVATPMYWHLARLYMRGGYRFASPAKNHEVAEVGVCTRHLSFAAAAHAVDRKFVHHLDGGQPYTFKADELLLPLTPRLKLRLRLAVDRLLELARTVSPPTFAVDHEALVGSLRADPVPGLDPDTIDVDWF